MIGKVKGLTDLDPRLSNIVKKRLGGGDSSKRDGPSSRKVAGMKKGTSPFQPDPPQDVPACKARNGGEKASEPVFERTERIARHFLIIRLMFIKRFKSDQPFDDRQRGLVHPLRRINHQ